MWYHFQWAFSGDNQRYLNFPPREREFGQTKVTSAHRKVDRVKLCHTHDKKGEPYFYLLLVCLFVCPASVISPLYIQRGGGEGQSLFVKSHPLPLESDLFCRVLFSSSWRVSRLLRSNFSPFPWQSLLRNTQSAAGTSNELLKVPTFYFGQKKICQWSLEWNKEQIHSTELKV